MSDRPDPAPPMLSAAVTDPSLPATASSADGSVPVAPPERPETPEESRRRRIAEARRQLDRYLDLGAIDPALTLWRLMTAAGEGWKLDPPRLQPIVDRLREEKRWNELRPLMADLIEQLQQRLNGLRLTYAQIAVKKLDAPELAIDTLAPLDHRLLTRDQRDLAIEMQGRARRRHVEGSFGPESEIR